MVMIKVINKRVFIIYGQGGGGGGKGGRGGINRQKKPFPLENTWGKHVGRQQTHDVSRSVICSTLTQHSVFD